MQVVKGDKMGTQCLGVQLDHPAPRVINTVDWPSRFGVG